MEVEGTVALVSASTGNVFFPDEEVRMRVAVVLADAARGALQSPYIQYEVTNYEGDTVAAGRAELHRITGIGGWAEIAPELPTDQRLGWFKIRTELRDGDEVFALQNLALGNREPCVSFAVVSEPSAGPLPDSFFGVCEHGLDEVYVEAMRRAGIRWLRTDVDWAGVQSSRSGPMNWARLDSIIAAAKEHGIEVLPIIDYTAPFAADKREGVQAGDPRRYPPTETDWRAFVSALAERYQASVRCWEVWNEANGGFWLGTPANYALLLKQAYEEIKAVDPQAVVSVGGTAGVALDWLCQVVRAGGGPYMDVVSVHPYRQPSPPEWGLTADLLRAAACARDELPARADGIQGRELWITEMGYHTLGKNAVSEVDQATFLTRSMVQAMAAGVTRFFWYEFADGSANPDDSESNFGIVHFDLTPKPAYVAYATLERVLGQARYSRTLVFGQPWLRAASFTGPKGDIVVAWSTGREEIVEWPVMGTVIVTDIMGREKMLVANDGRVRLTLTESPIYVKGIDLETMEDLGIADLSSNPLATKPVEAGSKGENLVPNPSFESVSNPGATPTGWSVHINGGAAFSWTHVTGAQDAPQGSSYMRLRNESTLAPHVYGRIHTAIKVDPRSTYVLSVRVRASGNRQSWIGGGPGWAMRVPLPQDTHGQWQEVQYVFTTRDETTWELMVLLEDVCEQVDVDDISVSRLPF